ncbi:MAG: UDP-2,3-diacylglucosamine diphosphatase [Planctomycetota bacterium]
MAASAGSERPAAFTAATCLIAADTHLDEPGGGAAMLQRFLAAAAAQKAVVLILGDLVNLWYESQRLAARYEPFFAPLREFTARGGRAYFVPGNRDFLAGRVFARATGLVILPEITDITVAGTTYRVFHGDQVYLGDRNYRIYRTIVRNGLVRGLLRILPDFILKGLAGTMQRPPDVPEPGKIIALDLTRFRKRILAPAIDTYLCGHVHRTMQEQPAFDGRRVTVRTVNSWVCAPEYVELGPAGVQVRIVDCGSRNAE